MSTVYNNLGNVYLYKIVSVEFYALEWVAVLSGPYVSTVRFRPHALTTPS